MNHVLVIGGPKSGKLTVLKGIFGDQLQLPSDLQDSHSGLIFNDLKIKTKYFETEIVIWVDEFESTSGNGSDLDTWCKEMRSDEAKEIRDVIKGIVFVFNKDDDIEDVKRSSDMIGNLIDEGFEQFDGIELAVAVSKGNGILEKDTLLELDDVWLDNGFEFVWFEEKSSKDMKLGQDRVKEVFETNTWDKSKTTLDDQSAMATGEKDDTQSPSATTAVEDKEIESMMTRLLHDYHGKELQEQDNVNDYDTLIEKLKIAKIDVDNIDDMEAKKSAAMKALRNVIDNI